METGNPGEIALTIRDRVDREKVPSIFYETEACIFRVPKLIREVKADAYTPKVVSIGPYHRMDERLHPMERFKLQCLDTFMDLSMGDEEEESAPDLSMELKEKSHLLLMSCVEKIIEKEYQIRGSYEDDTSLSRDDFVQMVLLDSVFIIWSFCTLIMDNPSIDDIPRLQHRVIKSAFERAKLAQSEIVRDLLLLENQLPLFIIDEIYKIRYPAVQGTSNATLGDKVAKFLGIELPLNWLSFGNLLALIRNNIIGSFQDEEPEYAPDIVSPTASHLHAAGVKFKADDNDYIDSSSMKIQFDKHTAVLTMPNLSCDNASECMYRNMIALEQCMYLYKEPTYIADFFHFLDCLIDTMDDVQLLADKDIFPKWSVTDGKLNMYNTMTDNTGSASWNYSYRIVCEDLNAHCNKKWNNYKATLKDKYFSQPWTIISVITAIVLLLLTIAQVILGSLALPGVL